MAKFKVGDKVIVRSDLNGEDMYYSEDKKTWDDCTSEMLALRGKTVTIKEVCKSGAYQICEGGFWRWTDEMFIGLATTEPRREFIVIRRDGAKTIAELRHDREIIKSGTAICNASDTFDFDTGAKLAFDRLMGREEPKPAPAPEPPKYYTGKVVCISGEYGIGKVFTVRNGFFTDGHYDCPDKPYKSVDDMNSRFLFGKFAALKE